MAVFFGIAKQVERLHKSGRVHGHLSTRKILRMASSKTPYRLCGLGHHCHNGRPLPRLNHRVHAWDPPEIARWYKVNEQSDDKRPVGYFSVDIWSLGCLLFQLSTGNTLFPVGIIILHIDAQLLVQLLDIDARSILFRFIKPIQMNSVMQLPLFDYAIGM